MRMIKPINPKTLSRVMRAIRAKATPESMRRPWTPEQMAWMSARAKEKRDKAKKEKDE